MIFTALHWPSMLPDSKHNKSTCGITLTDTLSVLKTYTNYNTPIITKPTKLFRQASKLLKVTSIYFMQLIFVFKILVSNPIVTGIIFN